MMVVSSVRHDGQEPDPLERWFSEDTDVRNSWGIGDQLVAFVKGRGTKFVMGPDGLTGCCMKKAWIASRDSPACAVLGWCNDFTHTKLSESPTSPANR
jgi:hypothetical protein